MASRKYEKLKKQKDAAISDIKNETVKLEVVSEEAKRVSEVSRNVSIILGDLDKQFEQATKLIDPFHQGKAQYTFENICIEDKELKLDDGAKKIFFNAKDYIHAEDDELREFLKYVNGGKSDNPFVKEIEDRVAEVKASKEWRLEYVTLLMREQEIWEEAEEKGREKEREEGIRGMVTVLKELGIPSKTILSKIQKQYNLSPEISKKYL
ncbi:hypothetical protein AALD74_10705 [Lachnospiraceae bacterium 48-21]